MANTIPNSQDIVAKLKSIAKQVGKLQEQNKRPAQTTSVTPVTTIEPPNISGGS